MPGLSKVHHREDFIMHEPSERGVSSLPRGGPERLRDLLKAMEVLRGKTMEVLRGKALVSLDPIQSDPGMQVLV